MLPVETLAERLFVTPAEAAELLDLDPRTVRAALQRGEIPGTRVGERWKIPTAWLRQQAAWSGNDAPAA
jgi:excisionase family DNA binding protein